MNILALEGGWTAGTLVSGPLFIICIITIFALGAWLWQDDPPVVAASMAIAFALVVGLFSWGMWPFEKEYHYWTPKNGVVEKVDKRLVADGEGMSEKIVIRFEGDPQQYGIEDTRAALLEPGDEATLLCKRAHQFGPSVDGYDCRWGA